MSSRAFAMCPGEEIVISGIAGRFPKSANVSEFKNKLYNKVISWIIFNRSGETRGFQLFWVKSMTRCL